VNHSIEVMSVPDLDTDHTVSVWCLQCDVQLCEPHDPITLDELTRLADEHIRQAEQA
jgi:hypothetical protein